MSFASSGRKSPRTCCTAIHNLASRQAQIGISTADHVSQLAGVADGAIVGSAVVRRMTQNAEKGPDAIVNAVAAYCRELLAKAR